MQFFILRDRYKEIATHFSTFLEDIAVAIVIVTRGTRLGKHVGNIVRNIVPQERRSETIMVIIVRMGTLRDTPLKKFLAENN